MIQNLNINQIFLFQKIIGFDFLLLPKHFVSCNAILNIDLFYYALDNCTKSYSLAHGIFLDKYVKAIFKSSFGPTGHEFIFYFVRN